ncbi:MAG: hypothetical protein ABL898_09645 [Hyphomicrobiaceae bacterium]
MLIQSIYRASLASVFVLTTSSLVLAQTLPGTKRDLDFDAMMKTVNLEDPSYRLEYKKPTPDGSSVGMFIGIGDKPTDRSFVPTNPSSIPEAEVVAYRLSRFLGISRNYYPVDYYKLGPKATAKFKAMIVATPAVDKDSVHNRNLVLTELKADPNSIFGIYRLKSKSKMFTASALGREGKFDETTGLSQEIKASGRVPDTSKIALAGIKGGQAGFPDTPTEQRVELARQLSTIFVMDMLLGQWDRFWNNLEATGDKDGRLKLFARDNGGATLDDWEGHDDYNRWVSRFDRDLITRLTALNAFLKGEGKEFAGYASVEAWKSAVGFREPASFDTFQKKLAQLIEKRVPALVKQYGDKAFFAAKLDEIARLDAADTGEAD